MLVPKFGRPQPFRGLGGFAITSGVAVPSDAETLGIFQGLQRVLNVGLARLGETAIEPDGRIGPGTMTALQLVAGGLELDDALAPFISGTVAGPAAAAESIANTLASALGVTPDFAPRPGGGAVTTTAAAIPLSIRPRGVGPAFWIGAAVAGVAGWFTYRKLRSR